VEEWHFGKPSNPCKRGNTDVKALMMMMMMRQCQPSAGIDVRINKFIKPPHMIHDVVTKAILYSGLFCSH